MRVYKYSGVKGSGYGVDYAVNGKRYRERVGTNKKEAAEYLGKKLKEIRDGKFREAPEAPVLFDDLADDYEKQAKGKKSYVNERYYIDTLREHFAGKILQELTVLDIERFQTQRKESPTRAKKTRSGATVNREMACLRVMMNRAVRWEMITKHPASKVKAFKESEGRNCFLSVDEAGRLLEAASRHLKPILVCALETGMRRAEILGLRWSEIRNGQIYLSGERTKNGKPREIPVSETLAEELQKLKTPFSAGLVFNAPRERKRVRHGILEVVTGPMSDIRVAWETAKKKAGISPDFRFHDLRHTFASHQKMAGTDDYTLMDIMGHSDHRMMKRYAHLTPEHKRKAVNSLPTWQKSVTYLDGNENCNCAITAQQLDITGTNGVG